MPKIHLKNFSFIFFIIILLLPQDSFALSYYDVIREELNYCENNGGNIVGIENGKVTENNGCPGCFCQFKDGSICKMEHLMKICKKGEYKTYLGSEEMNRLLDLVIESGTRGYVTSNPGLRRFYFFDLKSKDRQKLHYASEAELPAYFGTKWTELEEAKYLFFDLNIYNYKDVKFEGKFSLYFDGMRVKTWDINNLNTEGYNLGEAIYVFLDLEKDQGEHKFELVTDQNEMSKKNNVYSFYIDKEKFEYITHQDDSDYPRYYYKTFDGQTVDATQLELDYSDNTNGHLNNNQESEKIFWQKILLNVINFFRKIFKK